MWRKESGRRKWIHKKKVKGEEKRIKRKGKGDGSKMDRKNLHKGKKQVLDFFLAIEKDLW